LSRAERKRQREQAGGLPPPWAPPSGGPPALPRRRRRRRWPWLLLLLALLAVSYRYGAASYLGLPYVGQYPVSPSLPERVADLQLRDDPTSTRTAERLSQSLYDANVADDEVFAGVYRDDSGKRVTIFGTTGFRLNPESDVDAEMRRVAGEYRLGAVETYDLGEAGVHERCGVGRSGQAGVVVCSWADHGSLATVLLTRRSTADSAELVGRLRDAVLSPG
jgi:hypothetical protein